MDSNSDRGGKIKGNNDASQSRLHFRIMGVNFNPVTSHFQPFPTSGNSVLKWSLGWQQTELSRVIPLIGQG